jgi:hypothetical protein
LRERERESRERDIAERQRMSSGVEGRTFMEVGADGVALITFINPPNNSLNFDGTRSFLIPLIHIFYFIYI